MSVRSICFTALFLCPLLHADDLTPLRTALENQAKYRTVSVSIRQTKRVPALSEAIVQSGHLWMEPGKAFCWQLGKPPAQTAVFDGAKVYLLEEAGKTGVKLGTNDRQAKPLLLMLGFGEGATLDGMLETFTVSSTKRDGHEFTVNLQPKGNLKRALNSMVMQINTKTSFLERIEWTQRDGTSVVTEFFRPVIDKPLPAGIFTVKPEGYRWE